MNRRALSTSFFNRPVLDVAPDLLSCRLCRMGPGGKILRWQIEEVEAYDGMEDKACHAHKGRTGRTEVMFGKAGIWYIYLCYGVHWLMNIVTGPEDYPAAVLIRGAGGISGPGRLTRALNITGALNKCPSACQTGLWIEQGQPVRRDEIMQSERIGVAYAGPDWSTRPYRFVRQSSR